MIVSMTGFGKASLSHKKMNVSAELRSVNSKFLEVSAKLPQQFSDRESEVKEIIKQKISRGKINVYVSFENSDGTSKYLKLKPETVKKYHKLLKDIKKISGIREEINLEHILKFSEIFEPEASTEADDLWHLVLKTINKAASDLNKMKKAEGLNLQEDITRRLGVISKSLDRIEKTAMENINKSKKNLSDKIDSILSGNSNIDQSRYELEIVLLTDKLDITEEIVRARSHIQYFRTNMKSKELSGRRLGFLVQELNREINTMASKSNNSVISQNVVEMKEELEKIKEQLLNIE